MINNLGHWQNLQQNHHFCFPNQMDRGDSKQEEVSMLDGNHRAERNNRESAYGSNHDLKNASTAPP
ncbi:MAG: hypothetical protein QUS13_09040 [Smithella sp.]|nr:hypothetical protein [Smithella sp.]